MAGAAHRIAGKPAPTGVRHGDIPAVKRRSVWTRRCPWGETPICMNTAISLRWTPIC